MTRPDGPTNWLDVRLDCDDSQQARRMARRLRRDGAWRLQQRGLALWSIWPDDQASRQALAWLADLGPAASQRPFRAMDPLSAWLRPNCREIGPGLRLIGADGGLAAEAGLLVIDPLTAFGAGDHPSTWLNLALLARTLAGHFGPPPAPGTWAVDIGAGTGILALGMALLGGLNVLAVDPDPAARRACARNRRLNPLAGPLVHFVQGTHAVATGRFALAAANLPGALLLALAEPIAGLVAPGGRLCLSGFRDQAAPEVTAAFGRAGLGPIAAQNRHGWSALLLA